MNRKIYLIGMMALAMLFVSCKKEEKPEVQEAFSITASIENDGSKTYLDPNSHNPADGYKVKWYVGDKIKVFDQSKAETFTCKTVESTGTEANFTSPNPIDDLGEYWAFYPYNAVSSRSGNTFTFTMDAEQTFKDVSSFADDLFPMAAHYPSGSKSGVKLQFKNAFGILKIHVTRNSPITKIVLTDNNNHALSGDFTFNPETKTTAAAGNNSNVLTLKIPSNMQSGDDAPTDFYMILPPGCLDGAFNLKFYNGTEVVKDINKTEAIPNFAVERSKLKTANVDATKVHAFTVNADGQKVTFAKGNLYWDGSNWGFYEKQWYFDIQMGKGLFVYSNDLTNYGRTPNTSSYGTKFVEWGDNVPGGWKTISKSELLYILGHNAYRSRAIVNGVKGMIIMPDGWHNNNKYDIDDEYSGSGWDAMEKDGAVFLPASRGGIVNFWGSGNHYYFEAEYNVEYWVRDFLNPTEGLYAGIDNTYDYGVSAMYNDRMGAVRLIKYL